MDNVADITEPSKLVDTVAAHFSFKVKDKQSLLETVAPEDRASLLVSMIQMEIEVFRMDQRIKGRVKEQMEKTQRQYYLNEQMRAIKKEMDQDEEGGEDLGELEKRISEKKMSKRPRRRSSPNSKSSR
jgi:ATP-dependent Lon protease